MNAPSKELSEIIELVREAGKIVMRYRRNGFSVSTKTDEYDLVTEADHAVDRFLSEALRERFPEDSLLTEESCERPEDCSGRVWMVDPIDGMAHFATGREGFAVMIGLLSDGVPVLGVVHDPKNDMVYFASRGEGAWRRQGTGEPERMRVSDRKRIDGMTLVERDIRKEHRPIDAFSVTLGADLIMPEGGIGMRIMRVADGSGDALFCSGPKAMKWDYCAPQVILEEAGGRMTDFEGNPIDYLVPDEAFRPLGLASNGILHDELLERYDEFFKKDRGDCDDTRT